MVEHGMIFHVEPVIDPCGILIELTIEPTIPVWLDNGSNV
jgi:hypothetical protein